MRAYHHDGDDNAGSGASRPESRAASHYDSQSLGDDASSTSEQISGPLSGHAGASRFVNTHTAVNESAPSATASYSVNAGYTAASRAQQQRRDDKDRFEKARFDRYCRVRLDGELVARTSLSHSGANVFAVDKFKLKDVSDAKSLLIEVLHPVQKTSTSLSGSPSTTANKYILLGIVEIPIETLRRNEEVEGRFPIWSISTFPSLSQQQQPSSPTTADEDHSKPPNNFHRGVVGELNLTIRLHEDAVMPLSMYEEVYRRIHDTDSGELVKELAATMREDLIISHLVRIFAASGTVAERISSLITSESVNWGEKMEPELLFRANTLLSRSVDHFQRLLALSWLDDCLGPTVRKICQDPNSPSRPDTAMSGGSTGSGGGGEDAHFDFSTSIRSPPLLPPNAIDTIPDGPITTNALRKLSETMWQNIYSQRHSCPADLRTVLHQIRSKVNERYRSTKSTRPGIQGVGAFVFLRLFCAALNAPQLYGLTPSQPGRGAQRKLLLLSKVLLALASKKTAFDKDKDWELVPLNDLLRTYSSAYDDYISVVSTEPPTAAPVQLLGTRIDNDNAMQAAALRRMNSLSPLHRESIPKAPHMLDQPQALASFVSFVANSAEERDQAGAFRTAPFAKPWNGAQSGDSHKSESGNAASLNDAARIRQRAEEFVQICCQIEEAAGACIERAGYEPRPIPFERLQRVALQQPSRSGSTGLASPLGSSPARGAGLGDTSVGSYTSSMAGDSGDASPRSSLSRTRSRRATVSAANARPGLVEASPVADRSFERNQNVMDGNGGSPKTSRRKSIGFSRVGRRPSQVTTTTKTSSPGRSASGGYIAAPPPGRRASEMSETNTMTPRQPPSTRALASTPASASPHRHKFAIRGDEDDDHGSDDELRQAYRALRAEEEAAVQKVTVPSGLTATGPEASMAEQQSRPSTADTSELTPSQALGLETMGGLLEGEQGSVFEPNIFPPSPGFASSFNTAPPLSRSARQSVELGHQGSRRSSSAMPLASSTAQRMPVSVEEASTASEYKPEAILAQRRLGTRASFTVAPKAQLGGLTPGNYAIEDEAQSNRRHSSDHPSAPRNYSLPHASPGRNSINQHEGHRERRERSDGFETTMECAYAQTRASLPPSASMPMGMSSFAAPSGPAARYGNTHSNSTRGLAADISQEQGQGQAQGAAKKKKWWKV